MKKFSFLLVLLCLAGCGTSSSNIGIEEYNNELILLQEKSVKVLKDYYEGLEKNYVGSNLMELFTGTLDELQILKEEAENTSGWNDDNELKDAVVAYISGMESTFMNYEWPVVEILVDYTGQVSRFYKDNEDVFSKTAMKLAGELAILDKSLEESYTHFAENHGYKENELIEGN